MDVKLYSDSFDASHKDTKIEYMNLIGKFIEESLNNSGIKEDQIDLLIFADKPNYLKAIQDINSKASFTNNNLLGIGKTIPSLLVTDKIVCSIILNTIVVNAYWSIKSNDIKFNDIEGDHCNILYAFAHELGHCFDYIRRGISNNNYILEVKFPFKINTMSGYFTQILLEEFFACSHSAYGMNINGFNFANHENYIESVFDNWNSLKNIENENELKWDISQLFWIILIQHSKLVGFKTHKTFRELNIETNDFLIDGSQTILLEFENYLYNLWENYPTVNFTEINHSLETIWKNLSECNGYKFEERKVEDELIIAN